MRIGNRHEPSPNSAGAMCSSPYRIAADHQHCSTQTRGDYARLGLVRMPSRWSATIFYSSHLAARRLHSLQNFDFPTFRFRILWQAIHQHQRIPLRSRYISSLTMVDPKHRSLFRYGSLTSLSLHRCRPDLDLRRKKLGTYMRLASVAVWWNGVEQDGMRAADGLIGRYVCRMDGWMDGWIGGYDRGNEDVAMLEGGIVLRCQLQGPRPCRA